MSFDKLLVASPNAEVKHSDLKDFYPAANGNMAWTTIKPYIQQAEELFIIPHIGQEFYDLLDGLYNGSGITNADQQRVFYRLQTALGAYIAYIALPELAMRLGDAGIRENNNKETTAARQWVYRETLWKAQLKANKFLDQALYLMEQKVEEGDSNFDAFKDSSTYTVSRNFWIHNATQFSRYFNISNSRRTYVNLRPYIEKVQELEVRALLGEEMYTELQTQINSNNLTDPNDKLLEACRRYIAELTLIESIGDVNFIQDGSGWVSIENSVMVYEPSAQTDRMSQQMLSKAEANAARFRTAIERMIYSNIENYPTFRDSSANLSTDDDDAQLPPECVYGAVDL